MSLSVKVDDAVLSGGYVFPADQYINAVNLTISTDASIRVPNSTSLVIIGENTAVGDRVIIDASGIGGAAGSPGHDPGPPNPWISSGDNDTEAHNRWQDAVDANKNGTNNHIDEGTPGGNGGFGTAGGLVKLYFNVTSIGGTPLLRFSAAGGAGGKGGAGGPGRLLKCGGHGSHVWGAASGRSGADGRAGAGGRIEIYVTGPKGGAFLTEALKLATPKPVIAENLSADQFAQAIAAERAKHP